MRGRSPEYSPPRRSYGGRRRSPSPRSARGSYGFRDSEPTSLLVRNIPRDCRYVTGSCLALDFLLLKVLYASTQDTVFLDEFITCHIHIGQDRSLSNVEIIRPSVEPDITLGKQIYRDREG
jgi:hypothetical protein